MFWQFMECELCNMYLWYIMATQVIKRDLLILCMILQQDAWKCKRLHHHSGTHVMILFTQVIKCDMFSGNAKGCITIQELKANPDMGLQICT